MTRWSFLSEFPIQFSNSKIQGNGDIFFLLKVGVTVLQVAA